MSIQSLSVLIGTGQCNANCYHCAGKQYRKYAPKEDGIVDKKLLLDFFDSGKKQGANSISISSSGEPTLSPLSVTKTLKYIMKRFERINLYSNGILIGLDNNFLNFLHLWKDYGLTSVYITVYDTIKDKNAEMYRVREYPEIKVIMSNIHDAGLKTRANLILSKYSVHSSTKFSRVVDKLLFMGADYVSAWSIRGEDDMIDKTLSPSKEELDRMDSFIDKNYSRSMVKLLREKDREKYDKEEKLTLFPNGIISSKWCN